MKRIVYLIIIFLGCSKSIHYKNTEWVGKDRVFYIHFKGDSLAYSHGSLMIISRDDKRIIRYIDGMISDKLTYQHYKKRGNDIYLKYANVNSKYYGKFIFSDDSMKYYWNNNSRPISFRKLVYDSTIKLNRLKFSAYGCYGNCPVFDYEIDSTGQITFTAKKYFTRKGTYVLQYNKNAFQRIQDIIRKSFISEMKERNKSGCSDVPNYSLTVNYNNQIKNMKYDACNLDPEFIPLVSEIYNFNYLDKILQTDINNN
jgi:hypothetical protein